MRVLVASWLMATGVAAGASSDGGVLQRGRPRSVLANGKSAVAAFRAAWVEEVIPAADSEERRRFVGNWSEFVAKEKLSARKVSCSEAAARIRSTVGPSETGLFFFASTVALDRPGECWEVSGARAFNAVVGYFDPKTGALLFSWMIPEG